jgi:predicted helicase
LWKTFEHDLANGPGIVGFITASSSIDGDAFLGMRQRMQRLCDEIRVIDLGGEGRGTRQDDNVFAIQIANTGYS